MNSKNNQPCRYSGNNLLASLTVEYMRNIKIVLVNKPCMPVSAADAALVTLKRHLEDPDELVVLHAEGEGRHPIFNRTDIVVNNEENLEERIELTSHDNAGKFNKNKSRRSRSNSVSSHDSTSSIGSRGNLKRMPKCVKEDGKIVQISPAELNQRSYRQNDIRKVVHYNAKEQSPKKPMPKRIVDRDAKAREIRGSDYRENNSREYSRTSYRSDSSDTENCSRNCSRYNGFRNSSYKCSRYRRERESRSPSKSPKKYYRSPSNKRRGSPYSRRCSCSPNPDSKKESRFKEKRERERRERRNTRSSSRENEMNSLSHCKRDYGREKRSLSPQSKQNSHSPQSRPSSNKSHNEERRNRSPSKHVNQFGAPPYNFGFYGTERLWIPGQLQRPHFMPRNVMPPPIPMHFIPRPYMASVPRFHHRFRPRGVPYRHRMAMPNEPPPAANADRSSRAQSPNVREEPSSTSGDNEGADST